MTQTLEPPPIATGGEFTATGPITAVNVDSVRTAQQAQEVLAREPGCDGLGQGLE
jgi:hypothetical protein